MAPFTHLADVTRKEVSMNKRESKDARPTRKKHLLDNSTIGAAGVHYVTYRFLLRGMQALPTIRNTAGTDLVVTSRDGRKHGNIQIKTSQKNREFLPICSAKNFEKLRPSRWDYYVLLRRRREDDSRKPAPEFEGFMLTASEANKEMWIHLKDRKSDKFSLCIWVDKGKQQKDWGLKDNEEEWRKTFETWKLK
jgi:hypothetical protein